MYYYLLLVETYVKCIRTLSVVLNWAVRLALLAYRTVSTIGAARSSQLEQSEDSRKVR